MYAPSRTPTFAAEPGGSAPVTVAGDRENFRPVALPALAAAVHVSSPTRMQRNLDPPGRVRTNTPVAAASTMAGKHGVESP